MLSIIISIIIGLLVGALDYVIVSMILIGILKLFGVYVVFNVVSILCIAVGLVIIKNIFIR